MKNWIDDLTNVAVTDPEIELIDGGRTKPLPISNEFYRRQTAAGGSALLREKRKRRVCPSALITNFSQRLHVPVCHLLTRVAKKLANFRNLKSEKLQTFAINKGELSCDM